MTNRLIAIPSLPSRTVHDSFHNQATLCIGTGRLSLALHREYVDELRAVQEKCHFRYIRGHGLFCDDLGICCITEKDGVPTLQCNFTYLDRVMDTFLELKLKPFLELGFMPGDLASGSQTIFAWKANTTPPKDETLWEELVYRTLRHLCERYSEAEVATWPVEIWNEPNLAGFWENADLPAYLRLYKITSLAVRRAVKDIEIGGPAVCGGNRCDEWIDLFLSYCEDQNLPLNFITRHLYLAEPPIRRGRYTYHRMWQADRAMAEIRETKKVMAKHTRFAHIPLCITEFNTSYNPLCPLHDTVQNAARMAELLSVLGDECYLYSYWTFGDVFEEQGIPPTPFHGGFGLMASGCIPKPTLWTFAFYASLRGTLVHRDDNALLLRTENGYEGLVWQICPDADVPFEIGFTLPATQKMVLIEERVDESHANPLRVWRDLGQPASLSAHELSLLRCAALPGITTSLPEIRDGQVEIRLSGHDNTVLHFMLIPSHDTCDEGYDAAWYR
ncbi:MAG: xylan 1,4-beta-xylosidase [Clostridia bacterium]|nr:xylan 1,4-beta-xylosidase [Clostridia bacterium]